MQMMFFNRRLKLDWLTLLFPLLAVMLDRRGTAWYWLLALGVHEFAHWAVSGILGNPIRSIRLTPFGGAAELSNPYSIPPSKLCTIALAGPAANLFLILLSAALGHWGILFTEAIAGIFSANMTLMIFNLLPALPLDGGRILAAALTKRLPAGRVVCICVITGYILSAMLFLAAILGVIFFHHMNLSFLLAAVFILAASMDERTALGRSRSDALLNTLRPLTKPVRTELIAIDSEMSPNAALFAVRPDRKTLFAVFHKGRFDRFIDDGELVSTLLRPDASHANSPPPVC